MENNYEESIKPIPENNQEEQEEPRVYREKGDLAYFADVALAIEKMRVSLQVRIAHLAKTGRRSLDTEELLKKIWPAEKYVDARLAHLIVEHPTWPWASRIRGIGKENYPKVVGLIEAFGTFYDVGDPMIPPYITREPEPYQKVVKGKVVDKIGIWVEGIERLSMPSKLFKYAGHTVDETGKAVRRKVGEKIGFNAQLRMALFRLGQSLLRIKGIWYYGGDPSDGYSRGYEGHRKVIESMKEAQGFKIIATPSGRMCPTCKVVVKEKATKHCPDCNVKLIPKEEGPGELFQGHLHLMAMRRMLKEFELCLWLVWRQELGLPIPRPYDVERLGKKLIDPWKMVDRAFE